MKTTAAPTPKTDRVKQIAILYAVFLVIMAVAQLFTYEEFIELIPTFNLPLNEAFTYLVVPILIIFEVFALPFLLRMRLSPAFRFLSMLFGWLVSVKWLFISLWVVMSAQSVENIGFLGTVVTLTPGWWAVLISFSLGILAAWASWGMWPLKKSKK